MTPEREKYHELLAEFAKSLPDGALVYDIGRTDAYEYREWFPKQKYVSIDRAAKAAADYQIDVETDEVDEIEGWADGLVCNGVTEAATNPFALVAGCHRLMKDGGIALFGVRLLGYPMSMQHDYTRFTPEGAIRLLKSAGFRQIASQVVLSGADVPTYALMDCFK